ncbi:NAD(P)/FAD-dependent oxidoreductase [Hugenholtzia roseola]|uniref:NAD(P)/FAD-dependent oxidoreductase n=1 Tax=Hugenholtzia roseola TaxID=1002 RepID=UPI00055404C5|nr:NAD(P)/FAD-dependent oxidoreductase [Hugenholtzia roseola]
MNNLITESKRPRVVIVGGGFGGLKLAQSLRNTATEVVLFDKFNHHTFQPLLYQVATSGLETSAIVYPFRKNFGTQSNLYFRLGEVSKVYPNENLIETSIGKVKYDYLVIATGADTNFYGIKPVEAYAVPMKTIQDAIRLRNRIISNFESALLIEEEENRNSYIDFVIVGGGPTGVEIAGALSELRSHVFPKDYRELNLKEMDIHLIEAAPRLLNGMTEKAGRDAEKFLKEMNVQVHTGKSVKTYDGYTVTLNTGETFISRNLIWAAGVKGNPIAGLNTEAIVGGNRIKVDSYNRVSGYENIFAVGDVAAMITEKTPKGHPMVAPPAIQQGKLLAKNLQNLIHKKPLKAFEYKDQGSMATIGRNRAVVDLKKAYLAGWIAWLVWMFVHLMSLVGFRNRVFVFFSWLWSYLSYDKSNRLIIGKLGTQADDAQKARQTLEGDALPH